MLPFFTIGEITIFSYPLILGIIWGLAFHLSKKLLAIKKVNFPNFNVFFSVTFFSTWLGAKLLFLITLEEKYVNKAIDSANFWLGGGFVFYGGLILGTFTILTYTKHYKIKLKDLNFIFPVLALGHALGRVGCFLAGCCYGDYCELPWGVFVLGEYRHPVQLYEALLLLCLAVYLYKNYIRSKSLILQYFIGYSVIRFFLEFLRGDEIRGIHGYLSTSQWISFFIFSISIFISIYKLLKKRS